MVSIIVPVYNVEAYLEQCISTLLMLKTKCEIILVNDGSTDESGKICDTLAKSNQRIKVIHQENAGLSAARNTGINNASGDYIMFVDSDDFLDVEETDKMLSNLTFKTDIVVGLYRNYYMEQQLYVNESCNGLLSVRGLMPINSFLNVIPKDGQSCFMIACRFVVCKEFLEKNHIFFMSGIYHEDEEWTMRLLTSAEDIYVCHNYFYLYRQDRAGSIMGKVKPKHIEDRLRILHSAEKLLEKKDLDAVKRDYVRCRIAQLYLSIMIDGNVLSSEDQKKVWGELKGCNEKYYKYMDGYLGRITRFLIPIIGVKNTSFSLNVARKIKKRMRS